MPRALLVVVPVGMPSTWPSRVPSVSIRPKEYLAPAANSEAPLAATKDGGGAGCTPQGVSEIPSVGLRSSGVHRTTVFLTPPVTPAGAGKVPCLACVVKNDQEMWGPYMRIRLYINIKRVSTLFDVLE